MFFKKTSLKLLFRGKKSEIDLTLRDFFVQQNYNPF